MRNLRIWLAWLAGIAERGAERAGELAREIALWAWPPPLGRHHLTDSSVDDPGEGETEDREPAALAVAWQTQPARPPIWPPSSAMDVGVARHFLGFAEERIDSALAAPDSVAALQRVCAALTRAGRVLDLALTLSEQAGALERAEVTL